MIFIDESLNWVYLDCFHVFIIFWQNLERAFWVAADAWLRKKRMLFYFLFLKSCIPSIVVTYWKPASMSFVASSIVLAALHVHSSSADCVRNVACSKLI